MKIFTGKFTFLEKKCTFNGRCSLKKKTYIQHDRNIITRGCLESEARLTLHHPQRTTREKGNYSCFLCFIQSKALVKFLQLDVCLAARHQRVSISPQRPEPKWKIQTKVKLKVFVAIRRLWVIKRPQSKTAVGIQFSLIYLYSVCYNQTCLLASPTRQHYSSWLLFFCYHKIGHYDFLSFHKAQH